MNDPILLKLIYPDGQVQQFTALSTLISLRSERNAAVERIQELIVRVAELETENTKKTTLLKRLALACCTADNRGELTDDISGDLYCELLNYLPEEDEKQ